MTDAFFKTSDGRTLTKEETLSAIRNKNTQVIKEIATSDFADGGQLNRQQFAEFYREVIAESNVLDQVRRRPVDGPESQIGRIGVGERLLREVGETNAVTDQSNQINTSKVDIDVTKVGFGWDLSRETVEDTIEYENTAEILLQQFTDQYSFDLEALAFGGGLSDLVSNDSDFYGIMDGWFASAAADGAEVLDASSENILLNEDVLFDMTYVMPDKYVDATSPAFMVHPKQLIHYRQNLSDRETTLGDEMLEGARIPTPTGYPIIGSSAVPVDRVMFTDPMNLAFTPHRDLRVDVTTESEAVVKNDLFAQYAMTARVDFPVEQGAAVSIVEGLDEPDESALTYGYGA
jgi:hypothetical protein